MVKGYGWKNAGRLIWKYPAMILIPIFSFWTMGPPKTSNSCCGHCSRSDTIEVSYFYTFLNAIITIIVQSIFVFSIFIPYFRCYLSLESWHWKCDNFWHSLYAVYPPLIFSLILLIILRCCGNSECCKTPLTRRENFNIEDLHDHKDQNKEEIDLEMKKV